MAISGNATPLIALEAVIVDSETTGLDPANARLVELAAVPLSAGMLDEAQALRRLVRPDITIPPSSTAIHGIDDAAVASAPPFGEIWPPFSELFANRIVIGHSLGFDLAVLRQECARARRPWRAPRALDTRLLAQAVRPDLAGHSLDQLALWLEVEQGDRHSALGDALTTGRIFLALVSRLRERGVRTLAEAEKACRSLTATLENEHRAGWAETVAAPAPSSEPAPMRLDTHPYRHRTADVMSKPQYIGPDATIAEAVQRMARLRVSSLFVAADVGTPPRPENTGIVTERDVLRAIADHGAAALTRPVRDAANRPVLSVPADAFLYRAVGRMRRLKVRHLGVSDDEGALCGAVSARDLLRQSAEEAIWLGEEIDEAADVPQLARAWVNLPLIAEALLAEGMSGREVAAVISRELGALSRRAAQLAEARLATEGRGGAPCPYAFAVLGSAGRGESLLALDQDNALAFAEGAPDGPEDRWFAALATHIADILHEAGVPYCKGGVMAKNPQWRGSTVTWRDRIGDWIRRSDPRDLLAVDIFFDLRGVHGELPLTTALRNEAYEIAAGEVGFAKLLAEAAGHTESGLGLFGRIRTEQGRIDLKKCGLFGIVTAARVLSIRHHIVERGTVARLEAIKALGIGATADLDALVDAHGIFVDLILRQQLDDMAHGITLGNTVALKRLGASDRERLHAALESVRHVDEMTRDLLFKE
jgi:DNA polymerase-3 subunit epsilon/CBS domain-containing protein